MKGRNWFWGLFFLAAAVFVIASQTGGFGQFNPMSIAAIVLLAAIAIHSLINWNFFGLFVPGAFIYMICQKPLGWYPISIWLLLLAAVFLSIGFSMIFHSHCHPPCKWCGPEKQKFTYRDGVEQSEGTIDDDNNPCVKVSFGASSRYLHGQCLKSGQFYVSCGALEIYFDQARLSPEGAEIYLDCSLSGVKLYIPKNWQVVDHLHTSLGGVECDSRLAHPDENSPKLTLKGNISLSGVEIHYI